jgi:exopolysaccharide production protein ExoZ
MHTHDSPQKYLYLESFRGIAAILVAAYHFQGVIAEPQVSNATPFGGFFSFGHSGVAFFFVLSGYIIFMMHGHQLGKREGAQLFFLKRFIRIYPLFMLVMVLVTVKYIFLGEFTWLYFLKSVFLLPQDGFPMLIQSWTLVHEFLFYIIFGISIMSKRFGWGALSIYTVGSLALVLGLDNKIWLSRSWVALVYSEYNLLFVFGMMTAWLTMSVRIWPGKTLFFLGALFFTLMALTESSRVLPKPLTTIVYGLGSALMIWGAIAQERLKRTRWSRFQRFLGNISYPLYLIHGIVFSILLSALHLAALTIPGEFVLLVGLACAVPAAYLIHIGVEKPMNFWLKSKLLAAS